VVSGLSWVCLERGGGHRPKAKGERDWLTRKDPYEAVWPQVIEWLEAEPDTNAKEAFDRLRQAHPGMFAAGQLRTLQRRVREWRSMAVRRLMFTDDSPASRVLGDLEQAATGVVHKL
jgi:hypothetical protein